MTEKKYTITLDEENAIVHVVAQGQLFKEDGEEIITNARNLAFEHHFNILYDVRNTQAMVQFADWFFLPRQLPVFKKSKASPPKVAVLISLDNRKNEYDFYEIVTNNLGFELKVFMDESEAFAWLVKMNS